MDICFILNPLRILSVFVSMTGVASTAPDPVPDPIVPLDPALPPLLDAEPVPSRLELVVWPCRSLS